MSNDPKDNLTSFSSFRNLVSKREAQQHQIALIKLPAATPIPFAASASVTLSHVREPKPKRGPGPERLSIELPPEEALARLLRSIRGAKKPRQKRPKSN